MFRTSLHAMHIYWSRVTPRNKLRRVTITNLLHVCVYVRMDLAWLSFRAVCSFSVQTMVELLAQVVHGRGKEVGVWLLFTYHTPSTARRRIDAMAHACVHAHIDSTYVIVYRWHTMHARISVNDSQTEFRQNPTSTYVRNSKFTRAYVRATLSDETTTIPLRKSASVFDKLHFALPAADRRV